MLQLAAIGLLHQYRVRPGNDHFEFGWEMGRVARSIAQGHGFSSPYEGNTGPTAWEPPLYPYLMAGVFKLFGIYSQRVGVGAAQHQQPVRNAHLHSDLLHRAPNVRRTSGIWSAYAWGLNPYVWYWSIHWIWDTTFTPFVLACIFLLALELGYVAPDALVRDRRNADHVRMDTLRCSVCIGALANPTMLAFLPFCGLWVWRQRYRRGLPSFAGVVLSSLIFFAVLSPWVIRNYEVFHRFVFLRDDFGLQSAPGQRPVRRWHVDGLPSTQPEQVGAGEVSE